MADLLERFHVRADEMPVVLCDDGTILRSPSLRELAERLGLAPRLEAAKVYDVAVVGAGPAGLAAAVYAASEGLSVLVIEPTAPGGQAGTSSKIENYLGFPTGVSGQALAGRAFTQAQKFGADIAVPRRLERFACGHPYHELELDGGELVHARAVVLASGARYRKPPLPDLERFEGAGVYYAATHLEGRLCREQDVVVVGGGNSAGQAAVFLSGHARRVFVLVRAPDLGATMSRYLIRRIEGTPNIELRTRTQVVALEGGQHLERMRWRDDRSGAEEVPRGPPPLPLHRRPAQRRLGRRAAGARPRRLPQDRPRPRGRGPRAGRLAPGAAAVPAGDELPRRLRGGRRPLGLGEAGGLGGRRGLGVRAVPAPRAGRALRGARAGPPEATGTGGAGFPPARNAPCDSLDVP